MLLTAPWSEAVRVLLTVPCGNSNEVAPRFCALGALSCAAGQTCIPGMTTPVHFQGTTLRFADPAAECEGFCVGACVPCQPSNGPAARSRRRPKRLCAPVGVSAMLIDDWVLGKGGCSARVRGCDARP